MFKPLDSKIVTALRAVEPTARPGTVVVKIATGSIELPSLDIGAERYLLAEAMEGMAIDVVMAQLRQVSAAELAAEGLSSITFVLGGVGRFTPRPITLGITLVPLPVVIARLSGLPEGWVSDQERLLQTTLEPLEGEGGIVVPLRAEVEGVAKSDVLTWFEELLNGGDESTRGQLIYVRAEAGKGKSTVLASLVRTRLRHGNVPLPLFVPLRQLARGRGISWQDVVRGCGVVGTNTQRLATAVRHGLVMVVLDGLDEIAGRYDPEIVRQVLGIASNELVTRHSKVIISGRTTEAQRLEQGRALVVGLELPDTDSDAFSAYVGQVVDRTVADWGERLLEVPADVVNRLLPGRWDDIRPPTEAEKRNLKVWIIEVFDEFGRDRSLFFVQSLAGIGRCKQLDGNQVLYVPGAKRAPAVAPAYDITLLAAALACVREESKIEDIARKYFTADKQLDVLTFFTVLAVADETLRDHLPTPNSFAARIFAVDPENQNEEFTAIVRQNQKHALLFSANSSPSAGDWRPDFLSEWVRGVLLVRAWRNAEVLAGVSVDVVRRAVVRAKRSRLAFATLFADLFRHTDIREMRDLVTALRHELSQNSPEACANFWYLWAGLSDEERKAVGEGPTRVIDGTDLTGAVFENMTFGREFSPRSTFVSATLFEDCRFEDTVFQDADLSGVIFRSCEFKNVEIIECDGPVAFDNCSFEACLFKDARAGSLPALKFAQCRFLRACSVEQNTQPSQSVLGIEPLCLFNECETLDAPNRLFVGNWTGFFTANVPGLTQQRPPEDRDVAEECTRALLKPFFPSREGEGGHLQVRRYIRSSALGRGMFPPKSPPNADLKRQLEALGFTSGGREAHLYAPWASINGVRQEDLRLRQELLDFMIRGARGPNVEKLIQRLGTAMDIPIKA